MFSGLRAPEGLGVAPRPCKAVLAKSAGHQHVPQICVGSHGKSPVEQTDDSVEGRRAQIWGLAPWVQIWPHR